MSSSTCHSCRRILKARLHAHIFSLQSLRRGFHRTSILRQQVESNFEPWTSSLYIDSDPPNKTQRDASNLFFKLHPPRIAWVAGEWRKQANDPKKSAQGGSSMLTPEIAFLGRSNSGKSSLLNALVEQLDLCRVGPTPGKTKDMHAWALAASDPRSGGATKGMKGEMDDRLIVLDMPGYGHGSRDEWGDDIIKYLRARRQLKRVFVLINVEHGIKKSDEMTLQLLRTNGISHQVIACKADTVKPAKLHDHLLGIRQSLHKAEQQSTAMGSVLKDILAVGRLGDNKANRKVKFGQMLGVEEVRWAVLRAVGLEGYAETKRLERREKRSKEQAALNTERQRNGFVSDGGSKKSQTHSEAVV